MLNLSNMIDNSNMQNNPIRKVKEFMDRQAAYKNTGDIKNWRFMGYVLDVNYEETNIVTCDAYKIAVGGVPRGSFLIMVPADFEKVKPHFTLLRVKGVGTTPLSSQIQQTYFELQKKAMPELDVWTQSELQWGALKCDTIGMFYADPRNADKLSFAGDVNNIISPHRYEIYAPDDELLEVIVNGTVTHELQERIGHLRPTESEFGIENQAGKDISVKISMRDFMGTRTAMFGKTRLGKSNVVKLIAHSMLAATAATHNVGQLIFDINGEYANDSTQDNVSLRSANPDRCEVYALTPRSGTPSKMLKLNFYEDASDCKNILGRLLSNAGRTDSIYVASFASVVLPTPDEISNMAIDEKNHAIRSIQIYWAILKEAGFSADENKLKGLSYMQNNSTKPLEPHFAKDVREKVYGAGKEPAQPTTLNEIINELKAFMRCYWESESDQKRAFGKEVFNQDELTLLKFLSPKSGAGPAILSQFKSYHSDKATNFKREIISFLKEGKTVILDLGNATDEIRNYFSNLLSEAVFAEQENLFVNNALEDNYILLYFEEAHNLFPSQAKDNRDVYSRFAKEGAKFHIGMVYSTQSPSTISKELLNQTENFFVGHLASTDETSALTRTQIAFSGIEEDILKAKTPGFMRMLTMSNRFIVPVQADLYDPKRGV